MNGVARASLIAVALMLQACSIFTSGPSSGSKPAGCTGDSRYYVLPTVDTTIATVAFIAAAGVDTDNSHPGPDQDHSGADGLPELARAGAITVGVVFAASAALGFLNISTCHCAQRRAAATPNLK